MWEEIQEKIGTDVIKFKITHNKNLITCHEVFDLLITSSEFVVFFNDLLKNCPYEGYFLEVRPVSIDTKEEVFEFVLVDCPTLSKVKADKSAFLKYFAKNKFVTSFSNLSGDSKLIVPIEVNDSISYAHIANFVRQAPYQQIVELWKKVGEEFNGSIGPEPKWLSTSGLGVYWLHVRIDARPKYYSYTPYKKF